MYCLQWLIPVLLIPKPVNPTLLQTHVMFMVLYLIGFFLERKPCTTCSVVFLVAVFLICYSGEAGNSVAFTKEHGRTGKPSTIQSAMLLLVLWCFYKSNCQVRAPRPQEK